MNYKEKLSEARGTGKGVVYNFKKKSNYIAAVGNGFDCPHCGAYHGCGLVDGGLLDKKQEGKKIGEPYETPEDIKWNNNHKSVIWHEDCKCGVCGGVYSQSNGCGVGKDGGEIK